MEPSNVLNLLMGYYQQLILLAVVSLLIYWMKNVKNLPPGPWGVPIFGYIPFLKDPHHLNITKLSEKYGNVISIYLGGVLVIVLNDYSAIKEAFVKQGYLFSGKPHANHLKNGKPLGLATAEGEKANQHRRFILSTFKDLGMGKSSLEPHIMNEIKYFLNEIKKTNGQLTDLKYTIGLSVANIVAMLQFGNRLEYTDPFLQTVSTTILNSSKYVGPLALRVFLPWLVHIPFTDNLTGFKLFRKAVGIIDSYLSNVIKKKQESYIEGRKTNYIDSYITERKQLLEKTGSEGYFDSKLKGMNTDRASDINYRDWGLFSTWILFYQEIFLDENNPGRTKSIINFLRNSFIVYFQIVQDLLPNARNLYGAGVETTTSYLLWSILYMLKYPEARKRVQNEIDEVIGKGRDPVMEDKINMPYTEATLLEVHRMCTVLPFSLVHSNMEETKLFDYHIPKHSYVIANLWAVHYDKFLWKDPEQFKPERFIGNNGRIFKPEYLIPFSMGKRNCIGERLATTTTFLYFVSLFQQFNIQLPNGRIPSLEAHLGISLQPKPFEVCAFLST